MPTNEANKPKNGLPPIAHIPKNKVAPIEKLDETVDANKASLGIDNQFESDNRDRGQDDKALNKLPPLPSSGNVNVAAAFSPGFPTNVAHGQWKVKMLGDSKCLLKLILLIQNVLQFYVGQR